MKLWPARQEQNRLVLLVVLEAALTALPGPAPFVYWWGGKNLGNTLYVRPMTGPRAFTRLLIGWYIHEGAPIKRMFVEYPTVLEKRREFFNGGTNADTMREIASLAANLLAFGTEHPSLVERLAAVAS